MNIARDLADLPRGPGGGTDPDPTALGDALADQVAADTAAIRAYAETYCRLLTGETDATTEEPSIPAHQTPDSGSTARGAPAPRNRAERRQQARQRRRNRHR